MITLRNILEIENTPEILEFTFPNSDFLLWPIVRNTVIRIAIQHFIYGNEEETASKGSTSSRRLSIVKCVLDGLIHNFRLFNTHPRILFFSNGIANVLTNGKYFNRLDDHFAFCYPDSTLIMEDPFGTRHPRPRVFPNVGYRYPFVLPGLFAAKLHSGAIMEKPIVEFVRFLRSRLRSCPGFDLTEQQSEALRLSLSWHSGALKAQLRTYEFLYRRLKPRLIFFLCGMYGFESHGIRLAKEMGIRTAELQHGMVSSGHEAYNFAPAILNSSQYGKYTPDYFLAWGEWWAERINVPSEVIVIGNPHHETMSSKYKSVLTNRTTILLICSGFPFAYYLDFARTLRKIVPRKYDILIRPHPITRESVFREYGDSTDDISIDYSDEVYKQLSRSFAVVGDISTVLFEAIGFAEKIFAFNSNSTSFGVPDCPFERFDTAEELADKLVSNGCGTNTPISSGGIWADAWKANYKAFIDNHI